MYLFFTLRIFNSVNTHNHFVRGQGRAKSCKLDANSLKSGRAGLNLANSTLIRPNPQNTAQGRGAGQGGAMGRQM